MSLRSSSTVKFPKPGWLVLFPVRAGLMCYRCVTHEAYTGGVGMLVHVHPGTAPVCLLT